MKLNLKKINYHKWIPSRFSSFQAKLLIAFLVATLLPLTLVALVSYHVSYNLARDRKRRQCTSRAAKHLGRTAKGTGAGRAEGESRHAGVHLQD